MPRLSLSFLGSFAVQVDGEAFDDFATDKIRALLAYLAVEADRAHPRAVLATLLWPDYSDSDAMRNLRQSLYRLRLALDSRAPDLFAQVIEVTRQSVTLHSAAVDVDLLRFEEEIHAAAAHNHVALSQCAGCLARLADAVDRYSGEFLQGFHVEEADPFVEWQTIQRERAHHHVLTALQALASAYGERGDYAHMHTFAAKQVTLEPWREEAYQQLMQALALDGRRSEALAQYERCCEALVRELGVEPSPETTELYQSIRSGRLKAPSKPAATPTEKTPPTVQLHNFPQFYTPVFGREDETAQVLAFLAEPTTRIVSLLGAGGSGKTRLAVHTAQQLAATADAHRYRDGVYFVPLAAVTQPDLILLALASALALQLHERSPARNQVLDFLRQKQMLLIFDNFEHVIDGVELLEAILAQTVGVQLLVTSRVPLNLIGEQRFRVDGLRFPPTEETENNTQPDTLDDFLDYSGHRLFVQMARLVQPGFTPNAEDQRAITAICRLVQGMPLALEIAAAWVRLMACTTIEQEIRRGLDFLTTPMRNLPDRHRSIRAVFDYSWQRLSPAEQRTLAQLSVFRGDFTLDALLTVTDGGAVEAANLLDWALLQRSSGQRYILHELLRQYAEEQRQRLPKVNGETAAEQTERRHSRYFLDLVAREEEKLYGPALPQVQAQLRQSLDNIRQAWRWAVTHNQVDDLARSASGLALLLSLAGYWQEGEDLLSTAVTGVAALGAAAATGRGDETIRPFLSWLMVQQVRFMVAQGKLDRADELLRQALAGLEESTQHKWRAYGLTVQVDLRRMRGEYDAGLACGKQALAIFQGLGDRNGEAQALNRIGQIFWQRADYAQALDYQKQALQLEQALDHPRGVAQCLSSMGLIYYKQSQYDEALTCHQQALAVARALGNRGDVARHLSNIGVVYIDRGEHAQASAYYEEALAIDRELGNRLGVAIRLTNLGMIYWNSGDFGRGLAATEEAHAILVEVGHRSGEAITLGNMGVILWRMGEMTQALARHGAALALDEELGNWDCVARHLSNMGIVHVDEGRYDEAMAFYARAMTVHETLNIPFHRSELLVRKARLHLLRQEVDEARRLNEEGLALAAKVGRADTLFEGRLLAARLAGLTDPAAAQQILDTLGAAATRPEAQADVLFERWRLLGDQEAGAAAIVRYGEAYAQIPDARYRRRMAVLGGAETPPQPSPPKSGGEGAVDALTK